MQVSLRGRLNVDRFEEVVESYPPSGFVLPSGKGQYWRLRWDDEIWPDYAVRESAYNPNGGTPATRVSQNAGFVEMDAAHQDWRFNVIWRNMAPPEWVEEYDATREDRKINSTLAEKFVAFFDDKLAWCNHEHGSSTRAVYPWKLHLTKPNGEPNTPMSQQKLAPAGNVVLQVAPEIVTPKATWIPCKALKPNEHLSWDVIKFMPEVLHCCTVQRIELESNGHHRVNRFPQLTTEQGLEYDVPLVLISDDGIITFNKNMLSPVASGSKVPCPYNPARPFGRALAHWN